MTQYRKFARANVLDTASVAHQYRLDTSTIRHAILKGELPAWKPTGSKVWLMLRADVEAWRASKGKG